MPASQWRCRRRKLAQGSWRNPRKTRDSGKLWLEALHWRTRKGVQPPALKHTLALESLARNPLAPLFHAAVFTRHLPSGIYLRRVEACPFSKQHGNRQARHIDPIRLSPLASVVIVSATLASPILQVSQLYIYRYSATIVRTPLSFQTYILLANPSPTFAVSFSCYCYRHRLFAFALASPCTATTSTAMRRFQRVPRLSTVLQMRRQASTLLPSRLAALLRPLATLFTRPPTPTPTLPRPLPRPRPTSLKYVCYSQSCSTLLFTDCTISLSPLSSLNLQ